MNMLDQALADIPFEGVEESTNITETETQTDSPEVDKPVVEQPAKEGDNTPVIEDEDYKDKTSKRMQTLLQERKAEKERADALEERLARLETREDEETQVPERWKRLYSTGDDEQDKVAFKEWRAFQEEERQALRDELLTEIREKEQAEADEQEQMAQTYQDSMDELEAEGKKFDRNALMKFISERPIWRTDGQPDFATALELMELKSKPDPLKILAKKELATINKQGGEGKSWKTPEDLRMKRW